MIQVELFEDEDIENIENDLNGFLEKLEEEDILKVTYSSSPMSLASGVIKDYYQAMIIYRVKNS